MARVVPLLVGTDGKLYQLPAEVLPDWPIRYIMTFEGDRHPLKAVFAALFGARR
jgi:hypothetical protein